MLSDEDRRRYARHLVLPEIGENGQQKLLDAQVLVIGTGGLGSVAAGYLAAMGVGIIAVMDSDRVEMSNLQRQILFETSDIGQSKVTAAANRLEEINPTMKAIAINERLEQHNADTYISNYSYIVDATDNFISRILIHDICYKQNKILVTAAISGFNATITTYKNPFPCLHCLMPEIPEREVTCQQEGIVGALAGVIGSMQALETVKEILGIAQSLAGKLLRFDALTHNWSSATLVKDPACRFCNNHS